MKLELKHLSPYLPYKLNVLDTIKLKSKVMNTGQGTSAHWVGIKTVLNYSDSAYKDGKGGIYKPILRPLSELTKEYDLHNNYEGWKQEWIEHLWDFAGKIHEANILACPYDLMQDLLSKHFDVLGLIPKKLAIDINTLEK